MSYIIGIDHGNKAIKSIVNQYNSASQFQTPCLLQKKDCWNLKASITPFQVKGFL